MTTEVAFRYKKGVDTLASGPHSPKGLWPQGKRKILIPYDMNSILRGVLLINSNCQLNPNNEYVYSTPAPVNFLSEGKSENGLSSGKKWWGYETPRVLLFPQSQDMTCILRFFLTVSWVWNIICIICPWKDHSGVWESSGAISFCPSVS